MRQETVAVNFAAFFRKGACKKNFFRLAPLDFASQVHRDRLSMLA